MLLCYYYLKYKKFKNVEISEKICECSQDVRLPYPNFSETNSKCTRRNKNEKFDI
jgi:hypothetical protein